VGYLKKWMLGKGRLDACEIDENVMGGVLRGLNQRMLRECTMIHVRFVTFQWISRELLVQNLHPMASQLATPPGRLVPCAQ